MNMASNLVLSRTSNDNEEEMQISNKTVKMTCIGKTKFILVHYVTEMMFVFR